MLLLSASQQNNLIVSNQYYISLPLEKKENFQVFWSFQGV